MASKVKLINIAFDLVCFTLVLALFIVIKILTYGTAEGLYPTKRGFLCGDTNIQWPFKEDSISLEISDSLSFIVPIVVILIVEISNNMGKTDEQEEEEEFFDGFSLKPWMASMISLIVVLIFGGFLTEIIMDLSQLSVGRLRPSFMAVCQANITRSDCNGYVIGDVCNGDPHQVKMHRMSFPCAESAIAMYGMLFLAFYLQAAVRTETKLLRPLLQAVAVSLALFVGWARIADNKHFLSDVVAGFVIGGIIAWFMAFKILKLFAIRIRKPKVYTLLPQQKPTSFSDE